MEDRRYIQDFNPACQQETAERVDDAFGVRVPAIREESSEVTDTSCKEHESASNFVVRIVEFKTGHFVHMKDEIGNSEPECESSKG